MGGTLNVLNYI